MVVGSGTFKRVASCEVFGVGGSKFTCGTWEEGIEEANASASSSADTSSDDANMATGTAFAGASLTAGTTSGTASPSTPVSPTSIDCNTTSLTGTSITSGADICSGGGEEGSASTSIMIGKATDEAPATGLVNNQNFEKMKNLPARAGVLNSARSRRAQAKIFSNSSIFLSCSSTLSLRIVTSPSAVTFLSNQLSLKSNLS